jgi:hypothetical protein
VWEGRGRKAPPYPDCAEYEQVLQADWDGTFSEASYGFRPKHSAHQAAERTTGYGPVCAVACEKWRRETPPIPIASQ